MYFVHDTPGRLRIKIAYLKNHPERLQEIRSLLNVPGVIHIRSNAVTGSTLVTYHTDLTSSAHLLAILKTNGYAVDMTQQTLLTDNIRKAQEKVAMKVSKAALSWLAGRILEANGLSLVARLI